MSNQIYKIGLTGVLWLSLSAFAATPATGYYGSFDAGTGYTYSNNSTVVTTNDSNELLAFEVNGTTYSTGVNDALLSNNGVSFTPAEFEAFAVPNGLQYDAAQTYSGVASNWGGTLQNGTSSDYINNGGYAQLTDESSFLKDGTNGLELGTNVFNMNAQRIQYAISLPSTVSVVDTSPFVVATQTGDPGGVDQYYFVDVAGQRVGDIVNVDFTNNVPPVGIQNFAGYLVDNGAANSYRLLGDRDLRLLTFSLAEFNIPPASAGTIAGFVHNKSGASDMAFTAYNRSLLILETDSDGDGIADRYDWDDDNDGVTDAAECPLSADPSAMLSKYTGDLANFTDPNGFLLLRPSDFGQNFTGTPQTGLNVSHDYSSFFGLPTGSIIITLNNAHVHPTDDVFWASGTYGPTTVEYSGTMGTYAAYSTDRSNWRQNGIRSIRINDGSIFTDGNNGVTPPVLPSLFQLVPGDPLLNGVTAPDPTIWDYDTSVPNTYSLTYLSAIDGETAGNRLEINLISPKAEIRHNVTFSSNETAPSQWPTIFMYVFPECDTDKDGIPNRLDLDSDNDGCSDANEGAADLTGTNTAGGTLTDGNGGSVTTNLTTNDVDTNGVPTAAGNGQAVGESQVATKLEFDVNANTTSTNGEPNDVTITIGSTGQSATFVAAAVATSTTVFDASAQPDYTGTTTAGTVNYQWQLSTDSGVNWTDIAGATSASYTQTNVTAAMDGYQYRVIVTCDENVCARLESAALLTVNQPQFALTKTSSVASDTNSDGIIGQGDTITYSFEVENTGNVDLTNVTITDTKLSLNGEACVASLPVSTKLGCTQTYTYTLTQADVVAGGVENTATGTAKDPANNDVTDTSDSTNPNDTGANDDHDGDNDPANDPTRTPLTVSPSFDLVKASSQATDTNNDGLVGAGDVLTYTFTVENTGNVDVSNITLTDAKLGLTGVACMTSLPVNTQATCTGTYTYTLTQADVTAGNVENTATATGQDPNGNDVTDTSDSGNPNDVGTNDDHDGDSNRSNDPTRTTITPAPSLTLTKSATQATDTNGDSLIGAGDTLTYTFTVSNTGNVPLTNVTLTDAKLGLTDATCVATLAVGATDVACGTIYDYVITQADVNAGKVENSAVAKGQDPNGTEATDTSDSGNPNDASNDDDPTVIDLAQTPNFELTKSSTSVDVDGDGIIGVGDRIDFTFSVTNTGNVAIDNILLTDSKLGIAGDTCVASLAVGATDAACDNNPYAYTVTQADVDAGKFENTATATGQDPNGDDVTDTSDSGNPNDTNGDDDPTVTDFTPSPQLQLVKTAVINDSATNPNGVKGEIGETISYTFTVTNTGTVTIANLTVTDANVSNITCQLTTLAANASTTCTGDDYIVTQTDIDAGKVENSATTTGTDPSGSPVSDTSDNGDETQDGDDSDSDPTNDPTVTQVPSPPTTAVADVEAGQPGQPVKVDVTANDGDVDPTTVQIIDPNTGNPLPQSTPLVVPNEGTWTVDPTTGEITFTPEPGFDGDPTPIVYTVDDQNGTPSTATVTITYPNPAGSAQNDTQTGTPGNPIVVPVLDNDGADKIPSTVQLLNPTSGQPVGSVMVPGEGTWTVDSNTGEVTFTPEPGYTGTNPTPINYQVVNVSGVVSEATITVSYPAVSSTAAVNDAETGVIGQPTVVEVLANDGGNKVPGSVRIIDANGDPVTSLTVPGEGTWTVDATTGQITFTPESGFNGDPTPIQYSVEDSNVLTSSATVTVTYPDPASTPATAVADVEAGQPGQPVTVDVTVNDGDVDPTTVQIIDPNTGNPLPQSTPLVVPNEGTWTVDPTTGEITFTPEPGFDGDPTPIVYTVDDQNGTPSTATVTITYPNPAGSAQNDTQTGTPGNPIVVPVLDNDGTDKVPGTVQLLDPTSGQPVGSVTVPGEGTWTVDATTGQITFTPESGFNGDPTPIQYSVEDSNGLTSSATITIFYPAVAVTPPAVPQPVPATGGAALTLLGLLFGWIGRRKLRKLKRKPSISRQF